MDKVIFYAVFLTQGFSYLPQVILILYLIFSFFKNPIREFLIDRRFFIITFFFVSSIIIGFLFDGRKLEWHTFQRLIFAFFLPAWSLSKLIKKNNLFLSYYYVISISAIIGIIQFIGGFFGIQELYDIRGFGVHINNIQFLGPFLRVYSIYREPSILAIFYIPVIYILLQNILKIETPIKTNKILNIFIFVTYILTFSVVAYFILLVLFSYLFLKKRFSIYNILIFPIAIIAFYILITINPIILFKIKSLFINGNYSSNGTAFALYSNFKITLYELQKNLFIGPGYYGYEQLYNKDIYKLFPNGTYMGLLLNKKDAASMYLRVFAEFRIIGVVLIVYFIAKNYRRVSSNPMAKVFLFSIILFGIRFGQYDNLVFLYFLFSLMYLKNPKNEENIIYNT